MKKLLHWKFFLVVIILIATFFRFYQLGSIPAGFTNDEADIGYDAYAIYTTGHDQWNEFLPVLYFKGFGDYRPPLYTYLVVPFMPFVGLTAVAVRFPSAVFAVVSVILLFFVLRKLFSANAGLVGSFLFAVSPWSIGLSRMGIESNVAVAFLLGGILSFVYAEKKKKYFYLSMLLFVATLYMYAGYTLLTPLVLILLIFFYHKYFRKSKVTLMLGLGIFFLLCLPLFIQRDASAKIRFSQVNFLQDISSIGTMNILNDQRGECLKSFSPVICKVSFNKVTVFGSKFVGNYLSHFSVSFLFTRGTDTQLSILPQRGLLYIFEAFLLLAGFIWIINKKRREGYLLVGLLLISALPDTITGGGNYSRAFVMLPFLLSIEALGVLQMFSFFQKIKVSLLQKGLLVLSVVIGVGSVAIFFLTYVSYFRVFNSRFSSYGYEELMKYVQSVKGEYQKIYISSHLNDTKQYIYYLFYNAYQVEQYQQKKDVLFSESSGGWITIDKVENIYFVNDLSQIDLKSASDKEKILLISAPDDFPEEIKEKKYIKDLKGDALFQIVSAQELLSSKQGLQKGTLEKNSIDNP